MTGKVALAIGLAALGLTVAMKPTGRAVTGPPQHDTQTELGTAQMVRVEMRMAT